MVEVEDHSNHFPVVMQVFELLEKYLNLEFEFKATWNSLKKENFSLKLVLLQKKSENLPIDNVH